MTTGENNSVGLSTYRENTTLRVVITSLSLILVGAIVLFVSEVVNSPWGWVKPVLDQIGGLLVASGILSGLWDLFGKRSLLNEVSAKVRQGVAPFVDEVKGEWAAGHEHTLNELSKKIESRESVQAAGVVDLNREYLEYEWKEMFRNSNVVSLFISYGRTWRNKNIEPIKDVMRKQGGKIRVILPDPCDAQTIQTMSWNYKMPVEDVQRAILETEQAYKEIESAVRAEKSFRREKKDEILEIRFRPGAPVYALYMFDDRESVVTLYSHSRSRQNVPALRVGHGSYLEYFANEFELMWNESGDITEDPHQEQKRNLGN